MKAFKVAFFIVIFLFPTSVRSEINLSAADGVSNYQVNQSVTYQVEINYTLTHTKMASQPYYFKVARLNDRQPNSTLTQYCPPYQETELLYNSITGYDSLILGQNDKFNNTYDLFNASLDTSDKITLNQKYNVKLNEVEFGNIQDSDIGVYDTSDEIFDLYCNNSENFYDINDPDLIAASNQIVNPSDNPLEKARKICANVSKYLAYDATLPPQEKGASWAFDNERGDCSEYSTLMITLLRIQGIPARKVTGFLLTNQESYNPTVGQVFNFYASSSGSTNLLGHAWVEYYIPDIGWIACEPQHETSYKSIDFLRFNLNIGAWFSFPGVSPLSEFPHVPSPATFDLDAYTFDYEIEITVLGADLMFGELLVIIVIASIIGAVVIGVVLLIRSNKKKRKAFENNLYD
ncbi:MAG: transglutaminase domain-containing protein [Candidatus Lokiarchaeota archaeon]|nr:transglutaminase domain-containing protein [Candidatus Lokiarchaeota archaeon]